MASPDTPADRALIALAVERQQARIDQAAAEMAAELDLYRDDWSSRHAEELRAHEQRMRELEASQAEWLTNWLEGDPDGAQDPRGQVGASTAGRNAPASSGPGPGQQPISAAEMLEAEAIKNMSMQEYAALRAEFGIRSPTDMNRLFGETR